MSGLNNDILLDHLVMRELVSHLQQRPLVQNIDLMNTAGFCRNCLAKWRHKAAHSLKIQGSTYEDALQDIYGMSYSEYKQKHQTKASAEQLERFKTTEPNHAHHERFDSNPVPVTVPLSSVCCEQIDSLETASAPAALSHAVGKLFEILQRIGPIKIAILTVSDRASRGEYEDKSGPAVANVLNHPEIIIGERIIVEDDQDKIETLLRSLAASNDVILTTGGTGIGSRDVTPEATKKVIERTIPGISELIRREGSKLEPMAWLSRGVAGTCGKCAIINLPGHPNGARLGASLILPMLPRIVQLDRSE